MEAVILRYFENHIYVLRNDAYNEYTHDSAPVEIKRATNIQDIR